MSTLSPTERCPQERCCHSGLCYHRGPDVVPSTTRPGIVQRMGAPATPSPPSWFRTASILDGHDARPTPAALRTQYALHRPRARPRPSRSLVGLIVGRRAARHRATLTMRKLLHTSTNIGLQFLRLLRVLRLQRYGTTRGVPPMHYSLHTHCTLTAYAQDLHVLCTE